MNISVHFENRLPREVRMRLRPEEMRASDEALIAVVSMTRRGSVLVSFAFGALVFHEGGVRSKLLDLLLVCFSMFCLCIGATV